MVFFSVIRRIGDSGIFRDQMFAMKKYCTLCIYLCVLFIATHLFLRVKKNAATGFYGVILKQHIKCFYFNSGINDKQIVWRLFSAQVGKTITHLNNFYHHQ